MQKDERSERDQRHRRQSCEGSSERVRATREFQNDLRDRTKSFAVSIVRMFSLFQKRRKRRCSASNYCDLARRLAQIIAKLSALGVNSNSSQNAVTLCARLRRQRTGWNCLSP